MKKVSEFQAKQLVLLDEIASELKEKYPGRRSDVELTVTTLKHSLDLLSTLHPYSVYRYLRNLHAATSKYSEFRRALPTIEEVKELLK